MTDYLRPKLGGSWAWAVLLALVMTGAGACAPATTTTLPANVLDPDRYLMERGTEAVERERWSDAREYFRQIIDNYPQSVFRPDAKLGLAEAYMNEGGFESLLRARNEFAEFLTLYPTHSQAHYAQYQLAMTSHRQMRAAGRDQTETKEALAQFQSFFERFPNSPLMPDALEKWREARDRLSEDIYRVGRSYYRMSPPWYPGAIDRFREVLRDDPDFTRRDVVYFHLAESLAAVGNVAEAIPYYQRLIDEFEESDHLDDAERRLAELERERAQSQAQTR